MECLWGNTSIIIPKHEERAFCGREEREKSATAPRETRRQRGAAAAAGCRCYNVSSLWLIIKESRFKIIL
jgi:hypothetical protein